MAAIPVPYYVKTRCVQSKQTHCIAVRKLHVGDSKKKKAIRRRLSDFCPGTFEHHNNFCVQARQKLHQIAPIMRKIPSNCCG